MMNAEMKAKWTAALRSGNYVQGKHVLKTSNGRFCCIGVLGDIQGVDWDGVADRTTCNLPTDALHAGTTEYERQHLENMNDGSNGFLDNAKSFTQIADYIDANL